MHLAKTAPPYIPVSALIKDPFTHSWPDDFSFSTIKQGKVRTKNALKKLSNRGLIAYSIACGEWVIYRMSKAVIDLTPHHYTEAFWAYVMGRQELFDYPPELEHADWSTYETNPIDHAISSIMNVIYLSEFYDPAVNDASRIAELAKHVIADESLFDDWEEKTLSRLTQYCPRPEQDPEGDPIPRQIMDPSMKYNDKDRKKLIRTHFAKRNFAKNPFACK